MKKYTLLAILMCFSLVAKAQTSSGKHHIKYLDINSGNPDIGFSFLNDNQLVFASTATNKVINTDKYNPLLQFYKGEIDDTGAIINKEEIKSKGTSRAKTSKSGASFSKDGKTVYFSENKYAKRKSKKIRHELFKAIVDADGSWSNIEKVSFNKRQYSYRFPSINKDQTRLYFVSDAAPSFGGNDIFYVDIKEDGSFGEPVNLGEKVNTKGDETTPFIADNNFLYFSSNGRDDSLGNLDVYASEVFENTISEPLHLSSPINSLNDDYAYIVNSDNKGFFSSNRLQGRSNQDIYSFYIEPEAPKECMQEIVGTVRDKETEDLISGATINILDEEGKVINTLKSDLTGNYKFNLSCRNTYTVTADKNNYAKEEHVVNTANYYSAPPLEINQLLEKDIKEVSPEKVVINVNPIYFRFDKYNISSQAANELDKIVRIMKENPALIVESASHTDSRGPRAYNQRLSEKRSKAAVDYIVSKGIERSRITAKGYGESQLINSCQDGVRCSIEKHRLNRRTEFVIMNKQVLNDIHKKDEPLTVEKAGTTKTKLVSSTSKEVYKEDTSPTAGIIFVDNKDDKKEIPNLIDTESSGSVSEPKLQNNFDEQDQVEEPMNNNDIEIEEQAISEKSLDDNIKEPKEKPQNTEIKSIEKPIQERESSASDEKLKSNLSKPINKKIESKVKEEIELSDKKEKQKITNEEPLQTDIHYNDNLTRDSEENIKNVKKEEQKPTLESDFVVSNEKLTVKEKNIVLENQALSASKFNRDFSKEENNMTNVSRNLFDESDDFDSYSGNETNSKRLASQVSRKEAPQISLTGKVAAIREQFESNTKELKKDEILSVNAIDVSPMSIRRNGKYITTSSAKSVDVMRINFQIKNNEKITPGYKEVYILIQNPQGNILNKKGTFVMNNGENLTYTEKTNAYYNNNYLNLSMMTDRFLQKIVSGIYTVTIYIEGYPVGLEMFELS